MKNEEIKFIDLFAGIGGFRLGLEKCSTTNKRQSKGTPFRGKKGQRGKQSNDGTKRFTCVYSNEWDKYASSIYKKHFGECDESDIQSVDASKLPDFDLLCGGFPCQAFSIAGKRKGFDDTRGTLFFEIARILREKKPRLCLLENVKGLLSHDNGNTFKTIITTLDELGYDLQWQVLNSKNFGVPQNRERVFIIGHLRGTPRPKVFPVTNDGKVSAERQGQVSPTITSRYYKQGQSDPYILRSDKPYIPQGGNSSDSNNSIRRVSYTDGASIRRLTPTECERLQGFSDGWTEGISDTQRYKCLGNAVTTNVITWIGQQLTK